MQKKSPSRNGFDITNKNDIAALSQALIDVEQKFPIVFDFIETYCGYNTPVMSTDPYEITYAGGKRDVILTIKTIMRQDIKPEQIAEYYKKHL
jgi:hypothetical protein